MTSACFSPALSAGVPGSTWATRAPLFDFNLKYSLSASEMGCGTIPRYPLITFPFSLSWVTTFLARLEGIAKPIPMFPPEGE